MECQSSDSKKLFKVFQSSKRKRTRRKKEDDSLNTDGSTSDNIAIGSAKASLQDMLAAEANDMSQEIGLAKRDKDSSASLCRTPVNRSARSPRRHRHKQTKDTSLALKPGMMSTPRSLSPQDGNIMDSMPQDQDSFIYAFLEEAIKKEKKKSRHGHKHKEHRDDSRERQKESVALAEHRHYRKRREEHSPRERRVSKDASPTPVTDQNALIETFAKLCTQMNEKSNTQYAATAIHTVEQKVIKRTHSHKSLQCEVATQRERYHIDEPPVRMKSHENSREDIQRINSQERFHKQSSEHIAYQEEKIRNKEKEVCCYPYNKEDPKYSSRQLHSASRVVEREERYPVYPPEASQTKSGLDYRTRKDQDHYNERRSRDRCVEDEKRKCIVPNTHRSFDVNRERYVDDGMSHRATRSDLNRDRRYDERDLKRYDERDLIMYDERDRKRYVDRDLKTKGFDEREKFYDERPVDTRERRSTLPNKLRSTSKRDFDRNSVLSRDDYRERYLERERDSALSVADGETSTVSGRSNYFQVVKQEIAEQREAMDKMMKLWKDLMKCFKNMQLQGKNQAAQESAKDAHESATEQLRLWRECMRRYETVARDVGDTDARLMEEINKQRSEMAEMATMWQECLQRYRDMSNDFNSLKQKLATPRVPPQPPPVFAEGEGKPPPPPPSVYALHPNYSQVPPMPGGYPSGGPPLRQHASLPPAWYWPEQRGSPRRRSSPESRASPSRDRDKRHHRHKERERDETRNKEKSSKPSAARSEHRHRKR